MSGAVVLPRKATSDEVVAQAPALRRLAAEHGLGVPQVRDDGTVIVHSASPGYGIIKRFSNAASAWIGAYVHVITDDVPGAASSHEL
jgi:hypothetical protein